MWSRLFLRDRSYLHIIVVLQAKAVCQHGRLLTCSVGPKLKVPPQYPFVLLCPDIIDVCTQCMRWIGKLDFNLRVFCIRQPLQKTQFNSRILLVVYFNRVFMLVKAVAPQRLDLFVLEFSRNLYL